jgi:biopolymer transport protein TolR
MAMGMHGSARGRGRRGSGRRTPMAEINVTPLVDVMLVLLIIFMVTAPLLASGVPVELPDSRANPLEQEPDQITIAIDEKGFIYVDDVLVEQGRFAERLQTVRCEGDNPPLITLRADRALDYGRVMAVMGELNRAGCNSISLVTNSSDARP